MIIIKKFKDFLNEDRKPDIQYDEFRKKGFLDRIVINLKKQKGTAFTKLAESYYKLDIEIKEMSKIKNEINKNMKSQLDDLVNLEDKALTRVFKSATYSATLSKEGTDIKRNIDYEMLLEDLISIQPDLYDVIKDLKETYTEVVEKQVSSRLSVKQLGESINEGVFEKIFSFIKNMIKKINLKFKKIDEKLEKIENVLG